MGREYVLSYLNSEGLEHIHKLYLKRIHNVGTDLEYAELSRFLCSTELCRVEAEHYLNALYRKYISDFVFWQRVKLLADERYLEKLKYPKSKIKIENDLHRAAVMLLLYGYSQTTIEKYLHIDQKQIWEKADERVKEGLLNKNDVNRLRSTKGHYCWVVELEDNVLNYKVDRYKRGGK